MVCARTQPAPPDFDAAAHHHKKRMNITKRARRVLDTYKGGPLCQPKPSKESRSSDRGTVDTTFWSRKTQYCG